MRIDPKKFKERIGFYPNPIQSDILKKLERFTVVVGGRRLGKTILAAYLALRQLFIPKQSIWIIAPNHDLSNRILEYLYTWIYASFPKAMFRINKNEKIIENMTTGSKLWTKSGESPESLRGKGLDLAIIDEAALISEGLWESNIRPNLMDSNGKAFFISNPFGYNWFYKLYKLGTPDGRRLTGDSDYISFQVPTVIEDEEGNVIGTNNPTIKVKELANAKKITPSDVWRQEYLAMFQEGAGQRFKGIQKCIDESIVIDEINEWFVPVEEGHLYLIGVDLAKVEDFTVITIMDRMTNRLVGFWRVNNINWSFIKEKIKRVSAEYNFAECIVDATGGISTAFTEDLILDGINVTEFIYSNKSKTRIMDHLGLLIEKKNIRFPRIPQLIVELEAFSYTITPKNNMIYGSSEKDDCVNSLALACSELQPIPIDSELSGISWVTTSEKYD